MIHFFTRKQWFLTLLTLTLGAVASAQTPAQSVSEIITDYQGFWKSGVNAINPIKPVNSHNLVSFTHNGVRYSTGANDALLALQGQTFSPQQFVALPMQYFTGTPTSDTYIGVGQLYDGVNNGPSVTPLINNIPLYLNDGVQGLNLGTCVANIPSGAVNFSVTGINPNNIGDGIPDILITQIAQPSSTTDTYTFRAADGSVVGSPLNIVLTQISPVGNWTADFYRVLTNPMIIPPGFVNTDRPLRLWAADLSDFGITAANYSQISSFTVNLKGTSDLAFVAYNFATATVVPLTPGVSILKEGTYSDTNGNCIADAGDTINYTFTITNTGEAALTNVTVTDPNATIVGGPISLGVGQTNTTAFTGTHIVTASEAAAGAVYNQATVSGISADDTAVTITSTSQDPTPVGPNSPFYNASCPDCTVTVLPQTPTITIPVTVNIEGCGTASLTGLAFSTTPVSITLAQFLAAGGTTSLAGLLHTISYVDVAVGSCPTVVTRTFTVTNGCLVRTFVQTILIDDTTAPTASNPANITVQGCNATFPAPDVAVVTNAADNCSTPVVAWVNDSAPIQNNCSESIIRTYSVTDTCGNTINVTQTLTRTSDTVAPTASNPADITIIGVNQPIPTPDPSVVIDEADNCGVPTVAFVQDSTPVLEGCTETIIRTYSVTDSCNNSITVTQIIRRDADTTAPVTPVLATVTAQCQITLTAPQTTDDCAGVVTGTTTDPVTYTTPGTYTVTWTFTDGNGNTATANQTVIIDNDATPTAPVLNDVLAQCSVTVTAPSVIDGCTNETIVGTTNDPLTYNAQGTFVIQWTFTYPNNLVLTSNQNVIVDDTQAPTTPVLTAVVADCSATVTAPTTTDNCAGTITGTTTDPVTYTVPGVYTITWTFDDANGNVATATQTVTINNTLPTAPVLADVTGQCSATATAPSINGGCNDAAVTGTTSDPLTYTTQGTFVITWTFDFGNGNVVTATQNVIVDDTQAPVAPALADVTGSCTATATAPTAQDECEGAIVGTTTDPTTYTTQGTFVVTWTFTDSQGNVSTATQNVIVDNAILPTAPVLANVTGECSATVTAPVITDPCTNAVITGTTTDPLTYTTQGTFTVNWTFTFPNGTVTAAQTVIVDDVTAPVAPALADVTGQCSATVTNTPVAVDNCGGNITGTTSDDLTYTVQGTYVITWTFDDGNGNVSTATQNVIVSSSNQTDIVPALAECNNDVSPDAIVNLDTLLPTGTPTGGSWTDTDNSGGLNGSTFEPYQIATGTYTLSYVVADGDCSRAVEVELTVDDNCPVLPCESIRVHNALTPNGDGDNDIMLIDGITADCYRNNSIEIFNRWGVAVYDARNYDNTTVAFRGVSEGRSTLKKNEELPSGTYFYILKYTDESGTNSEKSGYLYISR